MTGSSNYNIYKALAVKNRKGEIVVKATGIIRKVDELGRIVLPIELRRNLNIEERDCLEIYLEGEKIILSKYEPACIFCGSSNGLVSHRGKNICRECIDSMRNF